MARALWVWGTLHFLIGSAMLFLTLHPLRDALSPNALHLVIVLSAYQAIQGLGVMALSGAEGRGKRIAATLMAAGVTASAGMIYVIAFTEQHPFDPAVPFGGAVAFAGWSLLLFLAPKTK